MNDQPKLITPIGQFDLVVWIGRNTSGIKPRYENVLILPDQASTMIGGVYVPPETIERIAEAAETGVMVAAGPSAWKWNSDRTRRNEEPPIEPGTRIWFARYSGMKIQGRDGLLYRLMSDNCIAGEDVEPEGDPVEMAGPSAHAVESIKLQEALTDPSRGRNSGF